MLAVLAACGGRDEQTEPMGTGRVPSAVAPSSGVQRSAYRPDAPVAALASGMNAAGFQLLRTLSPGENVVFSPASIGHALLMARDAADGPTRAAIDEAFGFPAGLAAHQAWNSVDNQIRGSESDTVTVRFADRIWPTLSLHPDQAWVDLLAAEHGADVVPLDLARHAEDSRKVINGWVNDKTDSLIPQLLPEGFIEPGTQLVLTDAVYFKAMWQTVFGKYQSVAGQFTTLDGKKIPTGFMRELELRDRRGVADGFAAAELPYMGNRYSMLVIVPETGRFEEIRNRLDQRLLDQIDTTFGTGPYELLLPKWRDTYRMD